MPRGFPGFWQSLGLLLLGLMASFLTLAAGLKLGLPTPLLMLLCSIVGSCTALAAGLAYAPLPWRTTLPLRAPRPTAWAPLLPVLAGAVVLSSELENLVRWLWPPPPEFTRTMQEILAPSRPGFMAASLAIAGLAAPAVEELLFRGLIQQGLSARYGARAGIALAAALFGAYHLQPWQAVPAFVLGLLLGWITWRSGSIGYAIALHSGNNLLAISLASAVEIRGLTPPDGPLVHVPLPWLLAAGALLLLGARRFSSRFPPAGGPAGATPSLTPGAPGANF